MDMKAMIDRQDNELAEPCGLIAKTYFNDEFTDLKIDGEELFAEEEENERIVYLSDIDK